jgi:hypothetical protein
VLKNRHRTLSWARWIQSISSRPVSKKVNFIIIIIILLQGICRSLVSRFFLIHFQTVTLYALLITPMCATYPHLSPPDTTLMNICWTRQIMKLLIVQFYHDCVTSSLLGQNIHPLSVFFSDTFSLCFQLGWLKFHTHTERQTNLYFCVLFFTFSNRRRWQKAFPKFNALLTSSLLPLLNKGDITSI